MKQPPDLAAKLAAFYAKYPRRTLRPGEKGTAELVQEARDERAEQIAPCLRKADAIKRP